MGIKLARPIYSKENILWRALIVTEMDSNELSSLINFDAVKKYYVWVALVRMKKKNEWKNEWKRTNPSWKYEKDDLDSMGVIQVEKM